MRPGRVCQLGQPHVSPAKSLARCAGIREYAPKSAGCDRGDHVHLLLRNIQLKHRNREFANRRQSLDCG
jgi:hypothetical protein